MPEGSIGVIDEDIDNIKIAVSPAEGVTTADGNVGGTTVIDTTRTEPNNHWNNMALLITSGAQAGQVREITAWDLATGTFTVSPAFGGQILAGVTYKILSNLPADIDITAVEAKLDHATYGLAALKDEIDANETKIDTVDSVVDAVKVQTDKIPRILCSMDFWSDVVEELQLTGTLQTNLALTGADVVIAGLPAGITIVRVVVMFMCRAIENTNASDNALDGAQNIEVNFEGGSFVDAINLADGLFAVAGSTREMGTVIIGDIDVKATVTGNGTCSFRIDSAKALLDNLNFNDYQVGVRVYFTV